PLPSVGIDGVPKASYVAIDLIQMRRALAGGGEQSVGQAAALRSQIPSCLGQFDHHLSFVGGISCPTQKSCRFEALEQGRQRARFQGQPFGYAADSLLVLAPEYVEHEI